MSGTPLLLVTFSVCVAGACWPTWKGKVIESTLVETTGSLLTVRTTGICCGVLPGAAWAMFYGAVVTSVAAVAQRATWTFDTSTPYVVSLVYLSVFGSVLAFGTYLTLLKRVGPTPSAYVAVATPLIALIVSTLFEGYRWSGVGALGVVLALAANWMALRPAPTGAARGRTG